MLKIDHNQFLFFISDHFPKRNLTQNGSALYTDI